MPSDDHAPLPPHLDPRGRRASRHVDRRGERHVAVKQVSLYASKAIATALSLALLIGTGVYWWQYRQFRSGLETVSIKQAQNTKLGNKDIDGKDQNILLVGNDDRTGMTNAEVKALGVGRDGGSMATDVMMILHVPADGKKATVISLPRDSYVAIPGNGKDKLNAAYIDGYNDTAGTKRQKQAAGINLLIEAVQNLTGLSIDHFALIGFVGFYRISEAVGPIMVNMCRNVTDPFEDGHGSGFHAHKGLNPIKGAQALAFVRQRYKYPDGMGDLDRVKRAQYFLTAAFRKVASAGGLLKLSSVLNAVRSSVVLDEDLDPLKLGAQMQALAADNIRSETIHWDRFATVNGQSVLVVDPAEVKSYINQWIGAGTPRVPAATSSTAATTSSASSSPAPSPGGSKAKPIDNRCIE